jgi:hypothetical protein
MMRLNVDVEPKEYLAFQSLCRRKKMSLSVGVRRLIIETLGADYFSRHGVVEEQESNGGAACTNRKLNLQVDA